MEKWGKSATVTYKRWRSPNHCTEGNNVEPKGESSSADKDICSINFNPGCRKSSFSSNTTEETFTLDAALDAIGFGWFQWKMLLLTGFSWVADAMEMMILSILGPQLHCEWRLPSYQVAFITSVVFIGMAFSSSLWGNWSDKYGRKKVLTICMCWTLYYSLLSAFAPGYEWLLVLRGLVGFGIGGAPQSVTLYSELLPSKARGISVTLISAFWSLGCVFEVLLALWIMPALGWRWLLILSAAPLAIFICFCFCLPESPRFDLLNGNRAKAMATLQCMAQENGKALPRGTMVCNIQNKHGRLRDLFTPQYYKTTLLLWFLWFSYAFIYYGIILLTTEMFQAGDSCGATQEAKVEPSCSLECKLLTSVDYKAFLWTTLAEFPGLIVILGAVDCLGRKKTMALSFFMFFLSILTLYACIGRVALTLFIFIARAFISGGFQVVFVYTPEVFPTETRALAMGFSSAFSKLGALITPFVAQVLLRQSVYLTLAVYCGCSLLAGIVSLLLPIETIGRALQESKQEGI